MSTHNQVVTVFRSFIKDINKVFPEYEETLTTTYSDILHSESIIEEDNEVLKEFLERVNKHNKKITNKDERLFDEDPLFLTGISFKAIWNDKITHKTKETIWKYLQTFCLLVLSLQSNADLQKALSELTKNNDAEITDKKVASDIKKIKKMSENIKEPITEDIPTPSPLNNIDELMQNSELGRIAQQVSESINLEEMLGGDDANPMDIMQKMMSGDMMGQIMNSIHTVVTEKVDSGDISQETIVKEANDIYGGIGDNPLFRGMEQSMEQSIHQAAGSQKPPTATPPASNKTQARLQKKLKQRQLSMNNE